MEQTGAKTGMLIALIIAGGLFAFAGLWLMFRPKPDGSSAKVELFGMKFESSSTGLLVFIIGAGFLALPLIAPGAPLGGLPNLQSSDVATPELKRPEPETVTVRQARAITVVGAESEPNDNIAEANEIPVGAVIEGEVQDGNPDFLTFTFRDDFSGELTVNLSGRNVGFSTFDDLGGRQLQFDCCKYSGKVEFPRYFIRVGTRERQAKYTLTVAARPE